MLHRIDATTDNLRIDATTAGSLKLSVHSANGKKWRKRSRERKKKRNRRISSILPIATQAFSSPVSPSTTDCLLKFDKELRMRKQKRRRQNKLSPERYASADAAEENDEDAFCCGKTHRVIFIDPQN